MDVTYTKTSDYQHLERLCEDVNNMQTSDILINASRQPTPSPSDQASNGAQSAGTPRTDRKSFEGVSVCVCVNVLV